ncbi:MAG: hypothetical protein IKP81_13400 [Paludibacteraceae bacterium]|nr:hypothetical protein [Paludibacteraceae bacterium]
MTKQLRLLIAVLSATLLLTACEDEPDFSTDGRLRLSYSTDSVKFEPLVTGQATSTRTIKVWNNSGEDLKIGNVELRSASNSFQMVVDGRSGTSINNLELLNGDSLFIFVRANLKENEDKQPVLINDSIVLTYNGNKDRIILNAVGQNAVVLRNYTIEKDTVWTNVQPFLVFGKLEVAEGATLTVKAGTEILFHRGASLSVAGKIDIRGNASDMVLLSGDRLDELSPGLPYTNIYGQWEGIRFMSTSTNNIMEGVLMRGATYGIEIDTAEIVDNQWRLTIANSDIRTSKRGNLKVWNARVKAYNSVFANGGSQNVFLAGGEFLFNHCTLSENSVSALRFKESLVLQGSEERPISNAQFNNCIINGSSSNEVEVDGSDWCTYSINNSLVNTTSEDTASFYKQCLFNKSAGFSFRPKYYYDFHIDSISFARNIGDSTLVKVYPECATDLDGNIRQKGKTDAGAYTFEGEKSGK